MTQDIRPANLIDRRTTAHQAHGPSGQWKVTPRPWTHVTGICLHQTACMLGERDERWDSVGAHVGVTRAGKVEWLHDFDRNVAHGNGWNAQTVGIEIDGLYLGDESDPHSVWDNPATPQHEQGMVLTPAAIEATKQTIRWICQRTLAYAGRIRVLVAHRQSSASRRDDPGSAIWKAVALPMHAELGLTDGGIGFKLGDGFAIPEAWDSRCVGVKY